MRISNALLGLAASALLITGCSSQKDPAANVLTQAEAALAEVRVDGAQYAPGELKAAEDTLAKLKADFAKEDYKLVLETVPQFNQEMASLKEVVVSTQTQMVAATREWETLSTEVPKVVEEIQTRVKNLSGSRLPKEVKKEAFEAAKASLETMKTTWAEATAAHDAGNALEAAYKARMVQAKGEEVKTQLAMNAA
jgi:PBP1b-binding outer membrane lipoprotein LpoB